MSNSTIYRILAGNETLYPFDIALARGIIPEHGIQRKFGSVEVPTSGSYTDIWSGASSGFLSYPYQTSAVTLEIASSSADDADAGTGANAIFVEGLDSNYDIISETVTLNGQTPVTSTNSYIRVYRAYSTIVGSGGVNAGDIWIADSAASWSSGVPTVNTYKLAKIDAGEGQTEMSLYTIPNGYTGYLDQAFLSMEAGAGKNCSVDFYTRAYNTSSNNNYESWRTQMLIGLSSTGNTIGHFNFEAPLRVPSKSDIKVAVKPDFTGSKVSCRFCVYLAKET